MQQAVSALRAASIRELREHVPIAWIEVQDTLAVSLQTQGELEWSQEASGGGNWRRLDRRAHEHLEESVEAARMGLQEASEQQFPILWAHLESEMGASLAEIGKLEAAQDQSTWSYHLNQAVAAERAALRVQSISKTPDNWADSEVYLGDALEELGDRESNLSYLAQAVAAHRAAARVRTAERDPDDWARIKSVSPWRWKNQASLSRGTWEHSICEKRSPITRRP